MSIHFEMPNDVFAHLSTRLAEAIHEDSNRELEWLWVASLMTDEGEYAYCLKRALYINPENRVVQRELERIHLRSMKHKSLNRGRSNIFAKGIQRLLNANWVKQYRWTLEER